MIDPNHQTWLLEATVKLGRGSFGAQLRCPRSRAVETSDDVHEIYAEVKIISGQGWSVAFTLHHESERDPDARPAAAAAYLAAWAFARVASVREDGNPYSLDIDTLQIPKGIVSFGENDLELMESYFGIPPEALREPPRRRRP